MEDRAPNISPVVSQQTATHTTHHEGRGAWVLTAYGVSALALFGVLAYYFSEFVTH